MISAIAGLVPERGVGSSDSQDSSLLRICGFPSARALCVRVCACVCLSPCLSLGSVWMCCITFPSAWNHRLRLYLRTGSLWVELAQVKLHQMRVGLRSITRCPRMKAPWRHGQDGQETQAQPEACGHKSRHGAGEGGTTMSWKWPGKTLPDSLQEGTAPAGTWMSHFLPSELQGNECLV